MKIAKFRPKKVEIVIKSEEFDDAYVIRGHSRLEPQELIMSYREPLVSMGSYREP